MGSRTWSGDLRPLRDLLTREARAADTGRAWRTLEDGTLVAVLLTPGAAPVLRLAREDAPEGWEATLQQLAAKLGCADWPREVELDVRAVALLFTQPEAMRTVPCIGGCGRPAPAEKGTYVDLCSTCTEERRVAAGARPADAGPACARCGKPLDQNARLFGSRRCSDCGMKAARVPAARRAEWLAEDGGGR